MSIQKDINGNVLQGFAPTSIITVTGTLDLTDTIAFRVGNSTAITWTFGIGNDTATLQPGEITIVEHLESAVFSTDSIIELMS